MFTRQSKKHLEKGHKTNLLFFFRYLFGVSIPPSRVLASSIYLIERWSRMNRRFLQLHIFLRQSRGSCHIVHSWDSWRGTSLICLGKPFAQSCQKKQQEIINQKKYRWKDWKNACIFHQQRPKEFILKAKMKLLQVLVLIPFPVWKNQNCNFAININEKIFNAKLVGPTKKSYQQMKQ